VSGLHAPQRMSFDPSAFREEEDRRVRATLNDAGAAIAPLPEIGTEPFVERAISRHQPFDSNGQNGYRDTVLWETAMAAAAEDDVLLITEDKDAFSEGRKSSEPSTQLLREAEERIGRATPVRITLDSAGAFEFATELVAASAPPEDAAEFTARRDEQRIADEQGRERLEVLLQDESFRAVLDEAIDSALQFWDLGHDLTAYGILPADIWSATVDVVDDISNHEIRSVHASRENLLLGEVAARAHIEASLTMHPSSAVLLEDDPRVSVTDYGIESGTGEAQTTVRADLVADLVIDPDAGSLVSPTTIASLTPVE
jgi:hypothetical protein